MRHVVFLRYLGGRCGGSLELPGHGRPVLEVKDDMITVQEGKEKWEIARDKDTKMTGDVKVGSKVTVHYTMKAVSVEGKEEAKKAEPKKK